MYKQVLLPIDLAEESSWRKALPAAIACAKAFGAELHIVTVMPDLKMPLVAGYFPEDFETKAHAEVEKRLHAFVAEQVPAEIRASHAVLSGGTIYERILGAAKEMSADLIVMAAYRPDLKDYLLGPNAARVVRHARQSVLVVRE